MPTCPVLSSSQPPVGTAPLQAESLVVRTPDTAGEWRLGGLHVMQGGTRALAGAVVCILLTDILQNLATLDSTDATFQSDRTKLLLESLLTVRCVVDKSSSHLEASIQAIARQNQSSRASPVNSYQWAKILRGFGRGSLSEASQLYNASLDPDAKEGRKRAYATCLWQVEFDRRRLHACGTLVAS